MTPDIERLAKEAGFNDGHCRVLDQVSGTWWTLEKFAALIAEECAKECDEWYTALPLPAALGAERSADAIRAKFALSNDKPEAK